MEQKYENKNFEFDENQKAWELYVEYELELWDQKYKKEIEMETWADSDKKIYSDKISGDILSEEITPYKYYKKQQINGYKKRKKYIIILEKFVKKPFSEITYSDYNNFLVTYQNKNGIKEKVRKFLFQCISTGIIENKDKYFLVLLLPEECKKIGKIIADL